MMSKTTASGVLQPEAGVLTEEKVRGKILFKGLTSFWTLAPFVLGTSTLLALWTFSIRNGIGIFVGIACLLASVGGFFTRLLLGGEAARARAIEDLQRESEQEREAALDRLDRELRKDGDPRTQKLLRDLRALAKAFRQDQATSVTLSTASSFDILAGVEQLFRRCVASLEKTLTLWQTARSMTTAEAREPIEQQRERIIEDVGQSITQLGRILAGIQSLGAEPGTRDSELAEIRRELDQSLEVARTVEKRMRGLDREVGDAGME